MKKSFILHTDSLNCLDDLTDEQVGQLFRAIKEYENTGKHKLTGILKAVFTPFENQLKRDRDKYQRICDRNKANADKRWDNNNIPDVPVASSGYQIVPDDAYSDSDSDSKKESKNKKVIEIFQKVGFIGDIKDLDSWLDELQNDYPDRDLLANAKKWRDHPWKKPVKAHKNSFRNWVSKEYAIKKELKRKTWN